MAVKDETSINLLIFIIAAVSIAASFNPGWHLWGLDSPKAFPIWLRLLFLVLLMLLAVPRIGASLGGAFSNLLESLDRSRLTIIYAILSVILVALFVILTSRNYFLGDGYTILGNIKAGRHFYSTEPLDYLVHQKFFKLLGIGEKGVYWSYALCSYACGIIFLLGLYYFIKNRIDLILSLSLVSCFAVMQFFFGYVESYIFSFIFMLLYSLSAIRDFSKQRLSLLSIALLCLAIGFHIESAVLIPSVVFLATMKLPSRKRYAILAGSSVLGLLAGIVYLIGSSTIVLRDIMVPLWRSAANPYLFLSGRHLKDLANLALLNYPLLLMAVSIRFLRQKLIRPFFLVLIGPGLLFTLLIDPRLGAFRDWDLLSIISAPMIAFLIDAIFLEKNNESKAISAVFIALALFGIIHTGGWIILNTSKEGSYARVKEEVRRDVHYSREYRSGYGNKSWGLLASKFGQDSGELLRAALERYNGAPDDTVNTCQLAGALLAVGDTGRAIELISENRTRFQGSMLAISAFSVVLAKIGRFDEAEQMCYNYLSFKEDDSSIYYSIGNIKRLRGQLDSSYYYIDKAFSMTPNVEIDRQFRLYVNCFAGGFDKIAQAGFGRILPKLPEGFKLVASRILDVLKEGKTARIDSLRAAVIVDLKRPASGQPNPPQIP